MRRTFAGVALILMVSGCPGSSSDAPAWPKSAGTAIPPDARGDGGESIEARPGRTSVEEGRQGQQKSSTPDASPPTTTADASASL